MAGRKAWRPLALVVVFICSVTTSVSAQQALAGDELRTLISGKNIRFSDGSGVATYKTDGKYEFFIMRAGANAGATVRGKWSVNGNRVCVDFDNGQSRCDQYIKEGGSISLKNSMSGKIPVQIQ